MPRGGKREGSGRPKAAEPTQVVRLPISTVKKVMQWAQAVSFGKIPLYSSRVPAGFPSPAEDHVDGMLDLNEHLIKHPAATFLVRASGDSMVGAGIHDNDILVVDKSLTPDDGKVVIAAVDGELTVKRISRKRGKLLLLAENPKYPPIEVKEGSEVQVWGVVTNVIHAV